MPLTITRRVGESFTLTWPTGEKRQIVVKAISITSAMLQVPWIGLARVDMKDGLMIATTMSDDAALIRVAPNNRGHHGQISLSIDAPKTIHILRDEVKRREVKS